MARGSLRAMIEQRAIVVHNLSVARQKMIKCVDLRDLTGISVAEIMRDGRQFIGRMQRSMLKMAILAALKLATTASSRDGPWFQAALHTKEEAMQPCSLP